MFDRLDTRYILFQYHTNQPDSHCSLKCSYSIKPTYNSDVDYKLSNSYEKIVGSIGDCYVLTLIYILSAGRVGRARKIGDTQLTFLAVVDGVRFWG